MTVKIIKRIGGLKFGKNQLAQSATVVSLNISKKALAIKSRLLR